MPIVKTPRKSEIMLFTKKQNNVQAFIIHICLIIIPQQCPVSDSIMSFLMKQILSMGADVPGVGLC